MMDEGFIYGQTDLMTPLKSRARKTTVEVGKIIDRISDEHPELTNKLNAQNYEWNEIGMASLFAKTCADNFCYCADTKAWYFYNGSYWMKDVEALKLSAAIKNFQRTLMLYASDIGDDKVRNSFITFVSKMGDRRWRDRMQKDIKDELTVPATMFDNNPYLINCLNGTYDLQKGRFRKARKEDYITLHTNITYDPDATCDRWEQFIEEIMSNDIEKAEFLQRCLGYSLMGRASEECMFILYGKTTRNGKSTLLDTLRNLLGDYGDSADVNLICRNGLPKSADAATPSLAKLRGKRFATMSESQKYVRFDEERIKQLTGGEAISARFLGENLITFIPQFKMWLSCNDLPNVSDFSLFASDRIKVISFDKHFTETERDTNLKELFQEEKNMSAIFNWLVAGFKAYKIRKLEAPQSVRNAVAEYQKDNDLVWQFLEEKTIRDVDSVIKTKDLYQLFKLWCVEERGFTKDISGKAFHSEMRRHECEEIKRKGYPYYKGIKIREET